MIKRIWFAVLLIPALVFAQDQVGVFPDRAPIFSKSIVFDQKLNRTAPFIALEQGTIVSAQNMRRPAPGVMAGWGPRRGMAKNNSTAIGNEAIDSLHQFINPTFSIRCFLAQTDDKIYLATNDPPGTGTTFGSSQISLTTDAGDMFSDGIGDDWVGAAGGTNPVAWSGGTAYPDGFKIVIGAATPSSISITNDGFETGNDPPTGWTEANATAVTGTTVPQGGSKDVEVTSTSAGSELAGIYQDIAAAPGVEYTISYWARRDALVTSSITNEGFETGGTPPTGWTNSNATSVSGTTDPHGGSKDAVITPTAADSESAGIYQDISVSASTSYTISYWAYRVDQDFAFSNGTFESGTTGWTANDATLASGTTHYHGGSKDLEVTSTVASSSKAGGYQDITVEPNTEYTLTSWAYRATEVADFVSNGTFEAGTTGWTAANATLASGTTSPHGGSKDLEITATAADSSTAGGYQDITVEPNTSYTITFWAYTGAAASGTYYPAAATDDGTWSDAPSFASTAYGAFGRGGTYKSNSFVSFKSATIPVGSEITGAYVKYTAHSSESGTTCNANMYFENADTGSQPTSYATAEALSLTSAVANSSVAAQTAGVQYDTPAMISILQGVVSRSGWSSGNALTWVIKNNASSVNAFRNFESYDQAPTKKPELHVTYTGGTPAITVQAYTVGDALISTPATATYSPTASTWTQYTSTFTTPATTSYIRLYLASNGPVGTKAEFDDVTVKLTTPTTGNPLAGITVEAYTVLDALISTPKSTTHNPTTATWTEYDDTFTTPATTSYIRVYLASNSDILGQVVEFDDITIAPTSDPYPQTNPSHVMQALNAAKAVLSTLDTDDNDPTDSTWTEYSADVITPVLGVYVRLYLGAKAPSTDFLNEVEFDDVEIATTAGGPYPSHVMQFLNAGSGVIETASTQNNEPVVGTWTQYSAQAISPALTAYIRLYLGCNSTPAGEVTQFDTLTSVVAVPPAGLDVTDGYEEVRNELTTRYIPYPTAILDPVYVGFRRPVDGIHFYISGTPNSNVETMAVSYWKGADSAWNPVGNLVDGTIISATTLAQSGSMTWDHGPDGETPRVLPGTSDDLYWYRLIPSGTLSSGLTVYKVTVADDIDEIANLWSGYSVLASGCLLDEGSGYSDYTAEVTDGTDVNYMALDSLANTSEVYVGFEERAQGINIHMVAGSVNGDATVVTVKYWDGDSWVSVGDLVDGTSNGTDSLAQTGMIQWDGDAFREIKMVLGGLKVPYFWYQLSWSVALDADVQVWEVSYAAKPDPLKKYDGVINYNNYALWWPGADAGTLDYSQQGYAHILNGPYAGTTLPIFGGGEVNAVTMLGTSAIVSTKDPYQTYYVQENNPAIFTPILVSDKVGTIAPKTLISIDSGIRLFTSEIQVRAAIFMAADGIYMTDGDTILNISTPISDYFDTSSGPYIEPEYMNISYAWLNHEEKTVHFAVPMNVSGSGTQQVLNREIVYAYLTDEWYDVYKRATAANCGLDVIGSANEYLTYVGGFLGYVYRSNTGTADGTTAITHNIKTSPILPLQGLISDPLNYSSTLRRIKIKAKADTTSSSVAGVTVFPDSITTGVSAGDVSLENTGYGSVAGALNVNQNGDEFALEFESSLLNATMELYGFTMDFMPQRPE